MSNLYAFNQIQNRHGQRIYSFSRHKGNTEIEKCINFITSMKVKYIQLTSDTHEVGIIDVICTKGGFEVFNSLGEKINEYDDIGGYKPKTIKDIEEFLNDLGYNLK